MKSAHRHFQAGDKTRRVARFNLRQRVEIRQRQQSREGAQQIRDRNPSVRSQTAFVVLHFDQEIQR